MRDVWFADQIESFRTENEDYIHLLEQRMAWNQKEFQFLKAEEKSMKQEEKLIKRELALERKRFKFEEKRMDKRNKELMALKPTQP